MPTQPEINLLYPFAIAFALLMATHLPFSGSLWQRVAQQRKMLWLFFLFGGHLAILFNMLLIDYTWLTRLPLIGLFSIAVYAFWLGALPAVVTAIIISLLNLKKNSIGVFIASIIGTLIAMLFSAIFMQQNASDISLFAQRDGAFAASVLAALTLPKKLI
ncbi:hypothetical protein ACKLNO_00270 [Neisseriaceae bacterium B1]